MNAVMVECHTASRMDETMGKRAGRKVEPDADETEQIGFRAKKAIVARIDEVADALGLDRSAMLRMMIIECLPTYEHRTRGTMGRAVGE
jgi:hypothetical protein